MGQINHISETCPTTCKDPLPSLIGVLRTVEPVESIADPVVKIYAKKRFVFILLVPIQKISNIFKPCATHLFLYRIYWDIREYRHEIQSNIHFF